LIQIFRKNWFVFTLLLLPYAILIRVWAFINVPDWPINTESESQVFQYIEQFFPKKYLWNVVLSSFVVFINAVQINNIVIKNRITREINLFPGMIFIFLSAIHVDMFWLSPQLVSISFLLAGISNIYRIYQKPYASIYIFNTGFFIGIAGLFYLPYAIFIFIAIISIATLRKFNILDFLQLIIAFIFPFIFLLFLWFWKDFDYGILIDTPKLIHITNIFSIPDFYEILIYALLIIIIVHSFMNYRKNTIKKSIQSQKKVNIFYWQVFVALLTIPFITPEYLFNAFLILFIPLSVFISMLFNRIKNEAALEMLHIFILFFIIFSHFWFN